MKTPITEAISWYQQPWPWILMAGPAIVIVAGFITLYLAIATNDGLVADDYYKRGLSINQTLSRDAIARDHGYRARIEFTADFSSVVVALEPAASGQLMLRLAHSGRPALDRAMPLTRAADQTYFAVFPALSPGRWQVTLEDAARTWRLVGDITAPGRQVVELSPR